MPVPLPTLCFWSKVVRRESDLLSRSDLFRLAFSMAYLLLPWVCIAHALVCRRICVDKASRDLITLRKSTCLGWAGWGNLWGMRLEWALEGCTEFGSAKRQGAMIMAVIHWETRRGISLQHKSIKKRSQESRLWQAVGQGDARVKGFSLSGTQRTRANSHLLRS